MDKLTKANVGDYMNVRLGGKEYSEIKKFCHENNYKIGAFIERAALEKIEKSKNNKPQS